MCADRLVSKHDYPAAKFSLYFYAFTDESFPDPEKTSSERLFSTSRRRERSRLLSVAVCRFRLLFVTPMGVSWRAEMNTPFLELTHNWGTESDESFKGYHNGNQEPRGFGTLPQRCCDTCSVPYSAHGRFCACRSRGAGDAGCVRGL